MSTLNLLTIIAEEALASGIEREIVNLGAKGYTASSVSGKGLQNVRDNQWEGENVKIETVVSDETCKKILGLLQRKYFDRYAMIAFYHPVNVVRTNHFL
jgi:nitrogen regulatory protein P-II 2